MKFSSALKFNAVSEWWDQYIAYDALKRSIYQLERTQHEHAAHAPYHDLEANESSALVGDERAHATDAVFVPQLDKELRKICAFYEEQAQEVVREVAELEELVQEQEQSGVDYYDGYDDEDDDEDDDISLSRSPQRSRRGLSSQRVSLEVSGASAFFYLPRWIPQRIPASHSRLADEYTRGHRLSISSVSSDGHGESHSPAAQPRGTISRIANKFMRASATSSTGPENVWTSKSDFATDTRMLYKRRITRLYIMITSLRSYVEVNYSGLRKILKKYDKVTDRELKDRYLRESVDTALPFTSESRAKLTECLNQLVELYTKCVAHGDRSLAKQQLKLHQRENIAWERDTVWRQMIGRERRGSGITSGALVQEEESKEVAVFPIAGARVHLTRRNLMFFASVLVFLVLLNVQSVNGAQANNCFAILIFCTLLWATEAIPLFVTSLTVPLLLVTFSVLRNGEGTPLTPPEATTLVFSMMFSPTIMLLIGGFTISSALSKTNIDRLLITRVLAMAGTRPSTVLLAFMGVSCFASMWISNVAAPTLCFALIKPILRTLPPKSSFAPCLILAIALAANIGGQSSPISSPQNLIALEAMDPPVSWLQWFIVALPVSAISILLIWGLLLVSYKPARAPDGGRDIEIKLIRPTREPFTLKQWWVTFVCILTIALWCVARQLENVFGNMGVIAIIPIVAFFATGVLKKDDFEQFAWTIVFLAMGGMALGKGVTSSGLLEILGDHIREMLHGVSLYNVVLILSPVVLVISTFISHTIASVLLVPIAKEVGLSLPGNHANLLIFITGLICSTGMGMPVSGFPNQTAANQEDDLGVLYLDNIDFLKNGVPASVIATLIVATVGYLLMLLIGL
ncbi:unnamed protein product [Mycena citricolor]|uniref:SPX domain-containing protein n=1 Tax=Mycena citricolor TaxID=2018698 RepID=A0AAD2H583_9AGAR|nr:unnamed protein product [Mycena citricolor]